MENIFGCAATDRLMAADGKHLAQRARSGEEPPGFRPQIESAKIGLPLSSRESLDPNSTSMRAAASRDALRSCKPITIR
ncbi:hypothetical protein [Paraburkholderia sp.]|uniref:hypothetical protein n=1 Tax=Paraburkholderia sp. TaxID=1926495 RepID=UPI0025F4D559|nr:hypothetical protein [Paraburkholderia sp.]